MTDHLGEAITMMRERHELGPEYSDELVAGMFGTQLLALVLARDALLDSVSRVFRPLLRRWL